MGCRTCLLVNLNGGLVAIDSNNLTSKAIVTYFDLDELLVRFGPMMTMVDDCD